MFNNNKSGYHGKAENYETILITGAGSGIGKETAKLFAAKGWNVIATMREPKNDKTFAEMDHVTVMKLDVTNKEDIETVASEVISQGGLDVLFNNAGIGVKGCLDATPEESIRQVFETDFMGPAEIMKAFIPYLKRKKRCPDDDRIYVGCDFLPLTIRFTPLRNTP